MKSFVLYLVSFEKKKSCFFLLYIWILILISGSVERSKFYGFVFLVIRIYYSYYKYRE